MSETRYSGNVEVGLPLKPPIQTVCIDHYELPFTTVTEQDGGVIEVTLDQRLAYDIPVAVFDEVMRLLANGMALALGMPSWPHPRYIDGEDGLPDPEKVHMWMGHLPFPLRPRRVFMAAGVEGAPDE